MIFWYITGFIISFILILFILTLLFMSLINRPKGINRNIIESDAYFLTTKIKNFTIRAFIGLFFAVTLYFAFIPYILDIPVILKKNYSITEGYVYDIHRSTGKYRGLTEYVSIEKKVKIRFLISCNMVLYEKYRVKYLPHTKIGVYYELID